MPVYIDSIAFTNEFRGETTDWLLGNIGDKITATINVTVKTFIIASDDNRITLNCTDGYIGDGWVEDDLGRFADVKVGDTLLYSGPNGTVNTTAITVIDKLNDYAIQLNRKLSNSLYGDDLAVDGDDLPSDNALFSVATPITGMRFAFNQIENDDAPTFNSLTSGSFQEFMYPSVDATDTTSTRTMIAQGNKDWQIGSATVKGLGAATTAGVYESQFRIIHTFIITPFFLSAEWTDLQSRIAPSYYLNSKGLKYIFKLDALYNINDPNRVQTIQVDDVIGNTGWFDENFNGNPTNYLVETVVYKRADTTAIPNLELTTDETTVEITIKNTTDTPFSNNNTKFVLGFVKAPEETDEYQDTGSTLQENFLFDRALQTVGSAAVNGDRYGTDKQIIKTVAATFVSTSEILITAVIAMHADVVTALSDLDNPRYILWVSTQNHTLQTKLADKVTLLVDADDFYQDTEDSTLLQSTTQFLRHPHELQGEQVAEVSAFPTDEIVAVTDFWVDKNLSLTDDIVLKTLRVKIKAKNSTTLEEFILERYQYDMSTLQVINDNQFVDYTLDRGFHIPSSEPRAAIRITREDSLDNSNKYYYRIKYPFLFRWEYWKALANVNGAFFDTAESNNGFNHEWVRYNSIGDWDLYHEIEITATKNGVLQTRTEEVEIPSYDFDSNADWNPNTIRTYDGVTSLYNAATTKHHILGYSNTKVEAKFTLATGVLDTTKVHVVLGMEVFEEGGYQGRRRYSSVWATESDTWFSSIDGDDKVKLEFSGNEVTASAYIDYTQLPANKPKFNIYARLYYLAGDEMAKLTEDGILKGTEDGIYKILEA